jgi:hypothetical protein
VNPNGVGHGLRPETEERVLRPAYGGMNHVGPGHVTNGTYCIFSKCILMFGTNSTKCQFLLSVLAMLPKLLRIEHSIISVNSSDGFPTSAASLSRSSLLRIVSLAARDFWAR